MSLSNQATVRQQSGKSRDSNGPPLFGAIWGEMQIAPDHVKSMFFRKLGFREGSPLHAFIIRNRTYKRISTSYGFDRGIFCQDGCPVQCNNSIRSLTETPF